MADVGANIKVCNPIKRCSGLTGEHYVICHYSYNLLLTIINKSDERINR